MKKLRCRILGGDWLLDQLKGKTVTVMRISMNCPFACDVMLDEDPDKPILNGTVRKGRIFPIISDWLEPVDVSDVPESHSGSLMLKQVWVFATAMSDAWNKGPPPSPTPAWYRDKYGEWTDERIWDVGKKIKE